MHKDSLKKIKNSKGFTLVESLVAIFILVISVTGPMYFASQALQSAYYARDQVVAFYLTQETMELIKNARDSNIMKCGGTDWMNGCGEGSYDFSSCFSGGLCKIGYWGFFNNSGGDAVLDSFVSQCTGTNSCDDDYVMFNSTFNMFGYKKSDYTGSGTQIFDTNVTNAEPTKFVRYFTMTNDGGVDDTKVTITIKWPAQNRPERTFTVTENIKKWIPIQ